MTGTLAGATGGAVAVDRTLTLPGGRVLGYTEYGDPAGAPLFFFHGTPGARTAVPPADAAGADGPAGRAGVRLIAPERPGYGLSAPAPGRTLRSWAADVRALADHLGLDRFAVAGASGGGPYALACAHDLADRVTVAGLLCTAGQVAHPAQLRRLSAGNRLKFGVPRYAPWLVRADLAALAPVIRRRARALSGLAVQRSAPDRAALAAPGARERLEALLREAFRGGGAGCYSDLVLGSRPWGFDVGAVRVPVHLWHGEADAMAPAWMAREVAAALPDCTAHFLPGVGHLLLGRPEVWGGLLAAVRRAGAATA